VGWHRGSSLPHPAPARLLPAACLLLTYAMMLICRFIDYFLPLQWGGRRAGGRQRQAGQSCKRQCGGEVGGVGQVEWHHVLPESPPSSSACRAGSACRRSVMCVHPFEYARQCVACRRNSTRLRPPDRRGAAAVVCCCFAGRLRAVRLGG